MGLRSSEIVLYDIIPECHRHCFGALPHMDISIVDKFEVDQFEKHKFQEMQN